jgi:hypothetical protein
MEMVEHVVNNEDGTVTTKPAVMVAPAQYSVFVNDLEQKAKADSKTPYLMYAALAAGAYLMFK